MDFGLRREMHNIVLIDFDPDGLPATIPRRLDLFRRLGHRCEFA